MKRWVAAGVLVLTGAAGGRAAEPLVLAAGAAAVCPVVAAPDSSPAERYAAEELSRHLQRICGAAFPVTNALPAAGPAIALAHDAALAAEEYRLCADPAAGRLTIAGGRPRGMLYGAYALLDRELGCRWFTPSADRVPHRDRLELPGDLDRRARPRLEYREVFWTEAFDGDWAARNRLNGMHARLQDRHGGKVAYGPFVHTFRLILDPERHFKEHPEYFSMVNGQRTADHTQLCLTHPDVLDHAIRAVREWIRKAPAATIFSVSQNDWHHPCECPSCKAIDDAEGSHAGSVITFVNRVAEAIEKDHPNVAIDTLAYQYTRKPPKSVRPRANVIVRLCSIECCFSHPLDGCPEKSNTAFMEDLRGWNRLTDRLYVWDYTTDFAHYLLPFPNLDVLDRNVRTFADHGVVGLFEQGDYSAGGGGDVAELRAWVLSRLLDDPSRDGAALAREFVAGVYGPAAADVQRYLDLRREALRTAGTHVRIYSGPDRPDLAPADLRAWDAALERAARAAGADAVLQSRIERLRMPVWYAQVWQARDSTDVVRTAAERLEAATKAQKLTEFHEDRSLEPDFRRIALAKARRSWTPPAGVVAGDDSSFSLYREGDLVTRVADPAADDGLAVRLAGRTTEWAVQWHPPQGAAAGRQVLRARLRVEKQGAAGAAFHAGVYDTERRKGLGEIRVAVSNAAPGYRLYDIAEYDFTPDAYAYVAPDDNPSNVTAIVVDRFELSPAPAAAAK